MNSPKDLHDFYESQIRELLDSLRLFEMNRQNIAIHIEKGQQIFALQHLQAQLENRFIRVELVDGEWKKAWLDNE